MFAFIQAKSGQGGSGLSPHSGAVLALLEPAAPEARAAAFEADDEAAASAFATGGGATLATGGGALSSTVGLGLAWGLGA